MTSPLALIVLFVFGAICAVAGGLWAAQRRGEALREATLAREGLLELADHWIWDTDASHALRRWRPPSARTDAWAGAPPLGEPMWRVARIDDAAASTPASPSDADSATPLRRLMDAHAPLQDVRVTLPLDGHRSAWLLRARPRIGRGGRFEGYLGRATPLVDVESAAFAQVALERMWRHADDALLMFRRTVPGRPWTLARASEAARTLLAACPGPVDAPAAGTDPLDWDAACAKLPAGVAAALSTLGPGETASVDGWIVGWTRIEATNDEDAGRFLSLRRAAPVPPPPAPAPAPAQAAASEPPESTADHESFIYSISHDLRAPIRVVEGFARILKEDYGRALDRIGNDHTERILAAAARMNHMIDALLALSRLQSQPLKRQPVDLSQLAAWIVEDLRTEAPDRQVEVSIEAGIVVQGDPTLLRNAMENLVGNAWKYSARNPAARIVFRRDWRDGQAIHVVEDNGAGFDMRFADRLFGVFQRLHSAKDFHGTGIGLASVRRILRRHGGDIWAESEVGKGARFFFTLP